MTNTSYLYKHFLVLTGGPRVRVYDPRLPPSEPALFRTTSVSKAEEWVDAYRAGQAWASIARVAA